MARYTKDIIFQGDSTQVFNVIHQQLTNAGFEYLQYDGENVFKKGKGVFAIRLLSRLLLGKDMQE